MSEVAHIFRWDVDKTYLKTEFDTFGDLMRTARLTAEERENVPGSAALIRNIRDAAPEGQVHQLYFVSGSPEQLRPVLEKKFAIDGFAPDGFVLKPAVSMLVRGRFRAIRSQVPYKLGALLGGRAEAPIGTRETLLGDDAESDAYVYSLYADVVAGRVSQDVVLEVLRRSGAYDEQIAEVRHELSGIVHEPAVRRVAIHLDQHTPPSTFADYFPRVVPIYNHLQTAIVLALDATLDATAIRDVARELIAELRYDVLRTSNGAEDIVRRVRLVYSPDALEGLAEAVGAVVETVEDEGPGGAEAATTLRAALTRIAERIRHVRSRPLPETPTLPPNLPPDYLALFAREQERREEAKRAKKLARQRR